MNELECLPHAIALPHYVFALPWFAQAAECEAAAIMVILIVVAVISFTCMACTLASWYKRWRARKKLESQPIETPPSTLAPAAAGAAADRPAQFGAGGAQPPAAIPVPVATVVGYAGAAKGGKPHDQPKQLQLQ